MMIRPRVIPVLLIENQRLIKTRNFKKPQYLGDPINAIKIFNEIGVDELCVIDKTKIRKKNGPDFEFLASIASEAFMPLSYGGGLTCIDDVKKIFKLGFEKVVINSEFFKNPDFIKDISRIAGSSSVVVAIDYKKDLFGNTYCYSKNGSSRIKVNPLSAALMAQEFGAGEIILTSIDQEGLMRGYDLDTINVVSHSLKIPLVANGGARDLNDIKSAIHINGSDAASAGSLFVYFGENKAILINYPTELELVEEGVYYNE